MIDETIPKRIKMIPQKGTDIWNPIAEKDYLVGKITEVADTPYGRAYTIVGDYTEGGPIQHGTVQTRTHNVLQDRMKKASAGCYCKITFLREEKSKYPNPTKIYDVELGWDNNEEAIA